MMIKAKHFDCLLIIIPLMVFFFFGIIDGGVICVDSNAYMDMLDFVEPIYPLFISIFRLIFGTETNLYLDAIAVFQSLLMGYAVLRLAKYAKQKFNTGYGTALIIEMIIISVSLMCRFVAKRGSMYSNSILTEGLAYPLFLIFFRHLFELLSERKNKEIVICTLMSILMISIRKQMYITLFLLVLVLFTVALMSREYKKYIMSIAMVLVIVFGGCKVFDTAYMFLTKGVSSTHTSDNRFLTTMVFYTSEREYASLIDDVEVRQLFLDIYDVCDDGGHLKRSDKTNWYKRVVHFEKNYDEIQRKIMWPMIQEHVRNVYGEVNELEVIVDSYNQKIIDSLFLAVLPQLVLTFVDNYLAGLMITVTADREIFGLISLTIYLVYFVLMFAEYKINGNSNVFMFSALTIISIIINVSIISITVFNQTRYTIYNMGLFYISGLLLLEKLVLRKFCSKNI